MDTRPNILARQTEPAILKDDLLWRHLKTVPAFRALLRSVESRFYQRLVLPTPILDLGCGDGHFAEMTFDFPLDVGVDPWWEPLQKTRRAGIYRHSVQALGNTLPFPSEYFKCVISNSVLEHVTDVQEVLNETARVLQPGGKLVMTVPSHYFSEWLGGATLFKKVGFDGVADQYRALFNRIARHAHTDPPIVWAARLATAGFGVERWQYYFSQRALWALEWGHLQGLPSAILHFLTGHWILAPWESNLRRTEQWVRPYYEEQASATGSYIFIEASKQPSGALQPILPEARPFDNSADILVPYQDITAQFDVEESGAQMEAEESITLQAVEEADAFEGAEGGMRAEPGYRAPVALISGTLIGLSLMFAVFGQLVLSDPAADRSSGLRWYGMSLITLATLAWRGRAIKLPPMLSLHRIRRWQIPRRRWLLVVAMVLALWAQRAANPPNYTASPGFAILAWIMSGVAAFYAFDNQSPARHIREGNRFAFDFLAISMLFTASLLLRLVKLTEHPFILNGAEASIGLDALHVAEGGLQSPFATGWLTNPTLLAFLYALPISILGPSALSVRLLSPIAGAATVVILYLVGRKFWGRGVGLVAALLLAGSHFHLQYSRLGMTNVWDPLLVLSAMALLGNAWTRSDSSSGRRDWLWAGAVTGLNAYFFTSSRLLPLILLMMFVLTLFSERQRLRRQRSNILAAAAMAMIVALPQLLYYTNNSTIFMERANNLGIFGEQSGWLDQQSQQTGQSTTDILRSQFLDSVLAFNFGRDQSASYKPGVPLLGFGPAVFFVLGLAIAMFRWRQAKYRALAVWIWITILFAGTLLIEVPSSHRLIIAAPALFLLAAIAMDYLGRQLTAALNPAARRDSFGRYLLPALVIISLLFSVNEILFYFGRYQNQHTFGDRNTEIADALSDYLNSLDGEWTVYFHGPPSMYVGFPTLTFLAHSYRAGVNFHDVLLSETILPPSATRQFVHIYLPERIGELESAMTQNPDGRLQTIAGFFATPLFQAYEIRE